MQKKTITIVNKLGLHARAAAKLVKLASEFKSEIEMTFLGKTINAKSIMGVMMLAAAKGSDVTFKISGEDESEALEQITALVNDRFGEEE